MIILIIIIIFPECLSKLIDKSIYNIASLTFFPTSF